MTVILMVRLVFSWESWRQLLGRKGEHDRSLVQSNPEKACVSVASGSGKIKQSSGWDGRKQRRRRSSFFLTTGSCPSIEGHARFPFPPDLAVHRYFLPAFASESKKSLSRLYWHRRSLPFCRIPFAVTQTHLPNLLFSSYLIHSSISSLQPLSPFFLCPHSHHSLHCAASRFLHCPFTRSLSAVRCIMFAAWTVRSHHTGVVVANLS